jgi:hypothetical protein
MAVHGRPTLLEIRNLFPTGFLGVIGLLGVEAANSSAHLWKQGWFLFLMGVSAILISVGLYGFVAHYKERAVPLILMGGTIGAVLLHAPLIVSAGIAILTLAALFYLLSPTERAASPEAARSAMGGKLVPATLEDADHVIKSQNEEIAQLRKQLDDAHFELAVGQPKRNPDPAAEADLKYVLEATRGELDVARRARESAERLMKEAQRDLQGLQQKLDESDKSREWLHNSLIKQSDATDELYKQVQALTNARTDWQSVEIVAPHGIPGPTALFVPKDAPVQTIDMALGNFQDVHWSGARMRITFTDQYRAQPNEYAVQLKIDLALGMIGAQSIYGGPKVESMGDGYFRLPAGTPETSGARVVYWHRMVSGSGYHVFALYVDHLNPKSGIVRLTGLFGEWSPDIGPMLEAYLKKNV